jgi:hypothetical protein
VCLVRVLEARQEGKALLAHHTRHMRLHTIRLQGFLKVQTCHQISNTQTLHIRLHGQIFKYAIRD